MFGCAMRLHTAISWWRVWGLSATIDRGNKGFRACFYGFLRTLFGVHPNTFDANTRTVEGPFEGIPGTSRRDGLTTNAEN